MCTTQTACTRLLASGRKSHETIRRSKAPPESSTFFSPSTSSPMDPPPPSYAEAVGAPTSIIVTFYRFSYVRTMASQGRRIGRRLDKRNDLVLISNDLDQLEFELPLLGRAGNLFGFEDQDRVAYTMIMRAKDRKDVLVSEANWEAIRNFFTTPGNANTSARLIMAVGPVVDITLTQKLGGLLLEAKRKLVGWSLPLGLA